LIGKSAEAAKTEPQVAIKARDIITSFFILFLLTTFVVFKVKKIHTLVRGLRTSKTSPEKSPRKRFQKLDK
jgi:hypothetical protein